MPLLLGDYLMLFYNLDFIYIVGLGFQLLVDIIDVQK